MSQFPENEYYSSDNLAADFFDRVKDRHSKHFDQWRHKYLHLALGGDSFPAAYISRWILGLQLPTGHYVSTKHNTTIDVAAMGTFLTSGTTPIQIQGKAFFKLHRNAIHEISEGVKLWEGEGSESVQRFRKYIKANWYIVPTNTQLVERWVKDSNECTHSGKEDHVASLIAVYRSVTVFEYKYEAKEAAKDRVLRGNQFLSSGKIGTRIWKGTGVVESQSNKISDVRGRHYISVVIKITIERSKSLELSPQQTEKRK